MYAPRNYYNRISQLQNPGQSFGMHQSAQGYRTQYRGPRGYKMHQHGHGNFRYQQNYGYQQNHGGHFVSLMQEEYYGKSKPQSHFRGYHNNNPANAYHGNSGFYQSASSMTSPGYHHQINRNSVHPHYNTFDSKEYRGYEQFNNNECLHYEEFDNDITAQGGRAIRGGPIVEDSLYPHGDPVPEDYLSDWDQRPECPRIKWDIPENPSWKPVFEPYGRDYSGTELILAQEMERERATRSDYFDNLRSNSCRTSEKTEEGPAFPDSSSMKSGSSFDSC